MINQGVIQSQLESFEMTQMQCFEKICQLLPNVLSSTVVHLTYQGKAYMELYDAHKKVRSRPKKEVKAILDCCLKGINGLNIDDPESWLDKAFELAPTEGHVLERLGRHYRQMASNIEEFRRAEKFLKACIHHCPTRHVAYHHLGLCYYSMWLEDNDLTEAKLHKNDVRNGKKGKRYGSKKKPRLGEHTYSNLCGQVSSKSKQKRRNKCSFQSDGMGTVNSAANANSSLTNDDASGNDVEVARFENNDLDDEGVCLSIDTAETEVNFVNRANSSDSAGTHLSLDDPQPDISDLVQQMEGLTLPKINQRTLYPNRPTDFGKMPKHFNKPDYYDQLRSSNPRNCPEMKQEYFNKAVECIKQANEIVEKTSCRLILPIILCYYTSVIDIVQAIL